MKGKAEGGAIFVVAVYGVYLWLLQLWYMFISGTYNNQYMVLDLKRVDLQKALQDNTLWIIEQIPG